MASTNLGSLATFLSASQFSPQSSCSRFSPLYSLGLNKWRQQQRQLQLVGIKICQAKPRGRRRNHALVSASATTLDSFFGGGEEGTGSTPPTLEELEKDEKPKCPPGLRHYETMAVLRPDISEEDRLALTQRYEEKIVAGGGMGVEVFNRGFIPLAYAIRKRLYLVKKTLILMGYTSYSHTSQSQRVYQNLRRFSTKMMISFEHQLLKSGKENINFLFNCQCSFFHAIMVAIEVVVQMTPKRIKFLNVVHS